MKIKNKIKLKQLLVLLLALSMVIGDFGVIVASASSANKLAKTETKEISDSKLVREGEEEEEEEEKPSVTALEKTKMIKTIKKDIKTIGVTYGEFPTSEHYEQAVSKYKNIFYLIRGQEKENEDPNPNKKPANGIIPMIEYLEKAEGGITKDEATALYSDLLGDEDYKSEIEENEERKLHLYYTVDILFNGHIDELTKIKESGNKIDDITAGKFEEQYAYMNALAEALYEVADKIGLENVKKYDGEATKIEDLYKSLMPEIIVGDAVVEQAINTKRPNLRARILRGSLGAEYGEVEITGYLLGSVGEPKRHITIPETIVVRGRTYKVVRVADEAFAKTTGELFPRKDVRFGEAKYLREIGKKAFYGLNIEKLDIPSNVRIIEDEAFANNEIDTLTLHAKAPEGNKVKDKPMEIGRRAFADNKIENLNMKAYKVDAKDNIRIDLGERSFEHNRISKLGEDANIVMGNIGERAFWQNDFTEFKVPVKTKYIGKRAFGGKSYWERIRGSKGNPRYDYYENNITSLTFDKFGELEEIGEEAFINHSLRDLKIPKSVKTIGERAFYAQNGMTGSHMKGKQSTAVSGNYFDKIVWKYDKGVENKTSRLISYCDDWDVDIIDGQWGKCKCNDEELDKKYQDYELTLETGREAINKGGVKLGATSIDGVFNTADLPIKDQGNDGNLLDYVDFYKVTNNELNTNSGVSKIGKEAFANNPVKGSDSEINRQKLYIPGSLNTIEDKIFYGNRAKVIKIDNGVKMISGDKAFAVKPGGNRQLIRVELPDTLMGYDSTYAFDNNGIRRVFFREIGGDQKVFDYGRYVSDNDNVNGKLKSGFFGASPELEYIEYPNYFDNIVPNNFSNDGYVPEKINQKEGKIRVVTYNKDAKRMDTGKDDLRNVTIELVGYQHALDNMKDADNTTIKRLNFVDVDHKILDLKDLGKVQPGQKIRYATNIKINEYEDGIVGDRIPGEEVVDEKDKNKLVEREIDIKVTDKGAKELKGIKLVGFYTKEDEIDEKPADINLIGEKNITKNKDGEYEIKIPRDKYYGNEGIYLVYEATAVKSLENVDLSTDVHIQGIGDKAHEKETISTTGDLNDSETDKEKVELALDKIRGELIKAAKKGLKGKDGNYGYSLDEVKKLQEKIRKLDELIDNSDSLKPEEKREYEAERVELEKDANIMEKILGAYNDIKGLNKLNVEKKKPEIEKLIKELEGRVEVQPEDLKDSNQPNIDELKALLVEKLSELEGKDEPAPGDENLMAKYEDLIDGMTSIEGLKHIENELEKDKDKFNHKDNIAIIEDAIGDKVESLVGEGLKELDSKVDAIIASGGGLSNEDKAKLQKEAKDILDLINGQSKYDSEKAESNRSELNKILDKLESLGVEKPEDNKDLEDLINSTIEDVKNELAKEKPDLSKVEDLINIIKDLINKLPKEDQDKYKDKLEELENALNKEVSDSKVDINNIISEILDELTSENPNKNKLEDLLGKLEDIVNKLPKEDQKDYQSIIDKIKDAINKPSEEKPGEVVEDLIDQIIKDIIDGLSKDEPNKDSLQELLNKIEDLVSKLPADKQNDYQDIINKLQNAINAIGENTEDGSIKDLIDQIIKDIEKELGKENPNLNNIDDLLNKIKDLIGKLPSTDQGKYESILDKLEDLLDNKVADNKKDINNIISEILDELTSGNPDKDKLEDLLGKLEDIVNKLPKEDQKDYQSIIDKIKDAINKPSEEKPGEVVEDLIDQIIKDIIDGLSKDEPNKDSLQGLLDKIKDLVSKLPADKQNDYKDTIDKLQNAINNIGKDTENDSIKDLIDQIIKDIEKELGKENPNLNNIDDLLNKIKDLIGKLPSTDQGKYESILDKLEDLLDKEVSDKDKEISDIISEILDELTSENPDKDSLQGLLDKMKDLISKLPKDKQEDYQSVINKLQNAIDNIGKDTEDESIKELIDQIINEIMKEIGSDKPSSGKIQDLLDKLKDLIGKLPEEDQAGYQDKLDEIQDAIDNIVKPGNDKDIKDKIDEILDQLGKEIGKDKPNVGLLEDLLNELEDLIGKLPQKDQEDYQDKLDKIKDVIDAMNKPGVSTDDSIKDLIDEIIKDILDELGKDTPNKGNINDLLDKLQGLVDSLPPKDKEDYQDKLDKIKDVIDAMNKPGASADDSIKDLVDKIINDIIKELGKDKPNLENANDLLDKLQGLVDKLPSEDKQDYQDKLDKIKDLINALNKEPGTSVDDSIKDLLDQIIKDLLDQIVAGKPDNGNVSDLLDKIKDLISKLPEEDQSHYQDILDQIKDTIDSIGEGNANDSIKDLLDKLVNDILQQLGDELGKDDPNFSKIEDLLDKINDLISKIPEEDRPDYQSIIDKIKDAIENSNNPEQNEDKLESLLNEIIKNIKDELSKDDPDFGKVEDLLDSIKDLINKLPEDVQNSIQNEIDKIKDEIDKGVSESGKEIDKIISEIIKELGKEKPNIGHLQDLLDKVQDLVNKLPQEDQKDYQDKLDSIKDIIDGLNNKPGTSTGDSIKDLLDQIIKDIISELGKDEPNKDNLQDILDTIKDLINKLPEGNQNDYSDILDLIQDAINNVGKPTDNDKLKELIDKIIEEINNEISGSTKPNLDKLNDLLTELEGLVNKLPSEDQAYYKDVINIIKDLIKNLDKDTSKPVENDKIKDHITDILDELGKDKPDLDKIKDIIKDLEKEISKLPVEDQKDYQNILDKIKDIIKGLDKDSDTGDGDIDDGPGIILPPPVKPEDPNKPDPEDPNKVDAEGYLTGYPDGTVRPNNNITREEVATILFRISDYKVEDVQGQSRYKDVKKGRWSERYITQLTNDGVLNGYTDSLFKPTNNMTRAEFVTAMVRLKGLEADHSSGLIGFKDTKGHWAEEYISIAVGEGWISGYPNGTFKPNGKITRAEVAKIVNGAMGYKLTDDMEIDKKFSDILDGKWYYDDMIIATGSFKYKEEVKK